MPSPLGWRKGDLVHAPDSGAQLPHVQWHDEGDFGDACDSGIMRSSCSWPSTPSTVSACIVEPGGNPATTLETAGVVIV